MDCSPPGSSIKGILQARTLQWVAIFFSGGIFPTQGSKPSLLHRRQILHCLSQQGSPKKVGLLCNSLPKPQDTAHSLAKVNTLEFLAYSQV